MPAPAKREVVWTFEEVIGTEAISWVELQKAIEEDRIRTLEYPNGDQVLFGADIFREFGIEMNEWI